MHRLKPSWKNYSKYNLQNIPWQISTSQKHSLAGKSHHCQTISFISANQRTFLQPFTKQAMNSATQEEHHCPTKLHLFHISTKHLLLIKRTYTSLFSAICAILRMVQGQTLHMQRQCSQNIYQIQHNNTCSSCITYYDTYAKQLSTDYIINITKHADHYLLQRWLRFFQRSEINFGTYSLCSW